MIFLLPINHIVNFSLSVLKFKQMKNQTLKRYKLIQEYPGSPVTASICTQVGKHHYFYQDNTTGQVLNRHHVENYPKFWKEIK